MKDNENEHESHSDYGDSTESAIQNPDKEVIVEEIVDIELYAKAKKKPPHSKRYKIRIDKEYHIVHMPTMTGRQILALVDKTPETYLLSQKIQGGQVVPITADQVVDFRKQGIERFQTLALDPTEGSSNAS